MEERKRFRNHISVIAEKIGTGTYALLAVLVGIFLRDAEEFLEFGSAAASDRRALLGMGLVLAVLLMMIVKTAWTWSKTWISIQDQAIVIEKNTVNGSVHTIGIRSISNINLEQNLFERLVGTYKVKIDTASLSTANATDVTIVLKKEKAEAFKAQIAGLLWETEEAPAGPAAAGAQETAPEQWDFVATGRDIVRHGLCSMSIFSIVIVVLAFIGSLVMAWESLREGNLAGSILQSAAGILAASAIVLSAVWDIVKDFVRYMDFRARREGDRIFIRYGVLKKIEYTVPVRQIQALKIRQTFIARLSRKYMARIINVGMGDDAAEKDSFLVLYGSRAELEEKLRILLPEFAGIAGREERRQPASSWAAGALSLAGGEAAVLGAGALAYTGLCGYFPVGSLPAFYRPSVLAVTAVLAAAALLAWILRYLTAGTAADDGFIKVTNGWLGRVSVAIRWGDVQYVALRQNMIARACGICRGELHLLAGAGDTTHRIPYFPAAEAEALREKLLT